MVVTSMASDKQLNTSATSEMDEDQIDCDSSEEQEDKDSSDGSSKDEKNIIKDFLDNAQFGTRYRESNYHASSCHKSVQAVVLAAGTGSRMTTLVTKTNKCLLPIASIPMLYYPIHMLQAAGFTECLVVVNSDCEDAVAEMALNYNLTIKLDIHTLDSTCADLGTLEAIRRISKHIKVDTRDVLLISGDLVSDINVGEMIQVHRHKGVALTMLTTPSTTIAKGATPGPSTKSTLGPDIMLESMSEKRLTKVLSSGEYEDTVPIPHSQLVGGTIKVTKSSVDAHLYIISNKLLKQYILRSPCRGMTSIKAEVIPHLISQQFKKEPNPAYEAAMQNVVGPLDSLMQEINPIPVPGQRMQSRRGCLTYHYDTGLCIRANTIPNYWYLNCKVPSFLSTLCPDCPAKVGNYSTSKLQPKAVVRGNTLLGAGCQLSDRTTIAGSSLGRNCVVMPGCRISNSVVMDNVTLEPGCVLDNCIVCCTIDKEKCTIKSSIVASATTLESNKTVTREVLDVTQFYGD